MRNRICISFIIIILLGISISCSNKKVEEKLNIINSGQLPNKGIAITYPFDNSLLPPELPSPSFEWKDSSFFTNQWNVFLLSEDGSVLISDKVEGMKWKPDSLEWLQLKKQQIEKRCDFIVIGWDKKQKNENFSWAKISFKISKDSVGAEVFFRAVTLPFSYAVKNVHTMEWYMGNVDGSSPRKMLDNMPVCANCHSFSKKDAILAMDVDYGNDKGSYVISDTKDTSHLTPEKIISWSNFKKNENEPTFGLLSQISPDGRFVLSTVKDLSVFVAIDNNLAYSQLFFPIKGIIGIYDRQNKEFKELSGANDQSLVQSNPSWSPDGKKIVFARTTAYVSERVANAGRALLHPKDIVEFTSGKENFKYDLYTLPFNKGDGGKPIPLKGASLDSMSNYFPKYSPDGKWIVFCKAKNFMLLQPDSRLYIIPAEGGEARLMNCNMSNMNSWHSWSPNGKWIVFSSKQRGLYTQLYLTHIDENGNDSPPVLLENLVFNERAANIPEFYPKNAKEFKKIKDDFSHTAPYFTKTAADQIENTYYKKAWSNLAEALKLDSTYIDAYFKRITLNALLHQSGSILDRKDKYAIQKLVTNLLEKNPGDEGLLLIKASLLSNSEKTQEALTLIDEILKKFPASLKTYELKASIYRKTKKFDKVIPVYQKLISLNPQSSMSIKSLIANAYIEMGKNDQALSLINELINKNPNFEGWRVMRAQINIDMKQLTMAKNDLDWLINKNAENYTYFQLLAHYHLLTNNSDNYNIAISKALSLLNSEIEKNPENIELYFQRASTLQSLNRLGEALSDYAHVQSIFPSNYEALKQTAKIKLMQQVWNEAISIYNVLLSNYPEEEEFYNNSALAYINMNNYQLASLNFKNAIKLNPDNVDTHYNLARLNKTMGQNTESEKEIDEVRKILERKQKLNQLNKNDKELLQIINEKRF